MQIIHWNCQLYETYFDHDLDRDFFTLNSQVIAVTEVSENKMFKMFTPDLVTSSCSETEMETSDDILHTGRCDR